MKFCFFIFLAFLCLPGFSQGKRSSGPRFIENIELSRDIANGSQAAENIPAVKPEPSNAFAPVVTVNSNIEDSKPYQFKYALLTDREVEAINDEQLYSFIDNWLNTPYRMGGTSKNGIDCSGFSLTLTDAVYGMSIPRTAKAQYDATERINLEELREGDLVFFNTRGGVSHVGVYLGNNYFVHSSTKYGVIISSLSEGYYHARFLGGGRKRVNASADSLSLR